MVGIPGGYLRFIPIPGGRQRENKVFPKSDRDFFENYISFHKGNQKTALSGACGGLKPKNTHEFCVRESIPTIPGGCSRIHVIPGGCIPGVPKTAEETMLRNHDSYSVVPYPD